LADRRERGAPRQACAVTLIQPSCGPPRCMWPRPPRPSVQAVASCTLFSKGLGSACVRACMCLCGLLVSIWLASASLCLCAYMTLMVARDRVVLETSTGCLLGASSLGAPGTRLRYRWGAGARAVAMIDVQREQASRPRRSGTRRPRH
jgi:hypothetical protein